MNKKLSNKDSKYFSLLKPDTKKQKPFIISSPHAGNIFLSGADTYNILNPEEYLYMQDMYVNDLILDLDNHGITILQNYISRLVIDLNRSEQEIDANFILNIPQNYKVSITPKVKAGLGLIPFKDSSGVVLSTLLIIDFLETPTRIGSLKELKWFKFFNNS